jgi:DNA-binding NtrC family response regulator/HAMP domain-containing protein
MLRALVVAAGLLHPLLGQQPEELVIRRATPVVDGSLAEWPKDGPAIDLGKPEQLIEGAQAWRGAEDAGGQFRVCWDNNHLYVAGRIRDDASVDQEVAGAPERSDRLEIHLRPLAEGGPSAVAPEASVLLLQPLLARRPWTWGNLRGRAEGGEAALLRQAATQLGGVELAARRVEASIEFEVAIPFHHLPNLKPGSTRLAFTIVLRDYDPVDGGAVSTLAWLGGDAAAPRFGELVLGQPGVMVPTARAAPLLSSELLVDLPYLLVPLATLIVLVFLLRGWSRLRPRIRWLRPVLVVGGVVFFFSGLALPGVLVSWRAEEQREHVTRALVRLEETLGKLEEGSLASYRGASRDRAVMDLLAGKSILRQRYTSYRSLAEISPQFGPPLREFDELPVRTYWLPLVPERAESFQFDPPLSGKRLHLVIARPFQPAFTFPSRTRTVPRLDLQFDYGATKQRRSIDLDLPFADCSSLGREFWEACVLPITLERELRTLTVGCFAGSDLRLVGISAEGAEAGRISPVSLGAPSRDGVLTDLRGPHPQDAGLELAPGATAKVTIPDATESPQRLWFFYRAFYPGLPTANPGARVAEITLHFGNGQRRTIALEHQVSMFYELAVHNTRDDPPEGSPASIALSWIDESQERHVNLGYPVLDLPGDTALEAIEFRNLAEYRMRFRSVVFVNDRAAAPQDPPDSPLLRGDGLERHLDPSRLAELRGASIALYRAGQLSESTLPLEMRSDQLVLPRSVGGKDPVAAEALLPNGARRQALFTPLRGDGWDGAVLAVSTVDDDWTRSVQSANRLGFLLCLVSAPFLLVLLSELLTAVTNLRFRLMAVLSVASLLPLGLLSLVLVRVLESGHAADVEEGLRATVRSTMGQLEDQKVKVQASARQWLKDLATLATDKLAPVADKDLASASAVVVEDLQKLLSGQLPPEWRGGFLRLEWQRTPDGAGDERTVLVAGDDRMANVEVPARLEPGVFMQWGDLVLGVRAEQPVRGGTFALTVGRPLDDNLLAALAPGRDLLLTDVRGYPLVASAGRATARHLFEHAFDPPTMAERERGLTKGDETRQPVVTRSSSALGEHVFGTEILRDLQGTPRGLLVVALPDERATLDLAIGRVPVRAFFLLVAGSLLVLSTFLSFVVSGRISRPIERLEHGAQALSRGVLDTRVPTNEGGQVGRLTRAFNQMAADLQGRLQDLQALNQTMSELAAELDEANTVDVLRRFCRGHTAADVVMTALLDESARHLVVNVGSGEGGQRIGVGGLGLAAWEGPFSAAWARGGAQLPWSDLLPQCRSMLALPIIFGGQARGVVLLGFEVAEPLRVDLELLSTVVSQASSACDRAWLLRLSVQDPVTRLFAPDYFRRRVVDELSLAQQNGRPVAMLAFALDENGRHPRGLQRCAAVLRDRLPRNTVLGHAGSGYFQAAVPGLDREAAAALIEEVAAAWGEPADGVEPRGAMCGVVAMFPEDGPSAEFLFDAVRDRLESVATREAVVGESDESLVRAGVTALSPAMRPVYGTLRRVAPTDLPILLEGETGVGKEVLTNLVHQWSRRADGPLVKVHCASLSETLLASELFGHERGAFTGADRRKIGRFEQAHRGTLFLDEVGDIPLDVQVKLLRALQEGEIDRVGGTQPVKVDVRVIAATNQDMARLVEIGRFREDLYYRLQGMVLRVPPLRERKPELGALVDTFRQEIVSEGHAPDRRFSTDAMDELYRQDWPGNIRQLRTTVFRAMVLARGALVLGRDVQLALSGSAPAMATAVVDAPGPAAAAPTRETADRGAEGGSPESPAAERTYVVPPPVPGEWSGRDAAAEVPAQPVDLAVGDAVANERLRSLLRRAVATGKTTTQDHMDDQAISHRTALRDLQQLVQAGLLERIGSRRGAHYVPTATAVAAVSGHTG